MSQADFENSRMADQAKVVVVQAPLLPVRHQQHAVALKLRLEVRRLRLDLEVA